MPNPHWKRTLYVTFFAELVTAIGFSSMFPFLPLFVQELGSSMGFSLELLTGLVFSGQAFAMMLISPVWGAVADRYGRKLMVERAMFGGTVILLLMAFVRSAEELVVLRTIQGLITGTVAAANALVAAVTPRERMGYAMGLLEVGLGTGVAVGPLIGGAIADVWGYSAAFYITSGMLFLAGLLIMFGVKEDFKPVEKNHRPKGGLLASWKLILVTTGVTVVYSLRFLSQFARNMIVPVAPILVQELLAGGGMVNTVTGLVTGVSAAATTMSFVYLGRLGDRIGHRKVLVAGLLCSTLLYFPQAGANAVWQFVILQALVGVAMGGVLPTVSALLARYTRPGEEGAVYGLDNSISSAGRAAAPLAGSAIAAGMGTRSTFTATGVVLLISTGVAAVLLPREKKEED
jgi:MFS transporter, DHA1 family, multidrug resistance protein